jgi:ESCRT-II complex subunit VPS25
MSSTRRRVSASIYTLRATFLHVSLNVFTIQSLSRTRILCRQQPNPETQAIVTDHWIRLLLGYARHRRLFMLKVEDAETAGTGGDWDEVLMNERINRMLAESFLLSRRMTWVVLGKLPPSHLSFIMNVMVARNIAAYEPAKQTRAMLLYWRTPEEWAAALHTWVCDSWSPYLYVCPLTRRLTARGCYRPSIQAN